MIYLTGIHALNIPCDLATCGDWHKSALKWESLSLMESEGSPFGDYGIEVGKKIPNHDECFNVANHIRALLDLLNVGNFAAAQGMNKDFICNPDYDLEVFSKVYMLKGQDNWKDVDIFMGKEYYSKWLVFREKTIKGA